MTDTLTVNVGDAKTSLSKLISLAEQGTDVIIARHGKPAVRLIPVEPRKPEFGFMPELAGVPDSVWFEPLSTQEESLWEDGPLFPAGNDLDGSPS